MYMYGKSYFKTLFVITLVIYIIELYLATLLEAEIVHVTCNGNC